MADSLAAAPVFADWSEFAVAFWLLFCAKSALLFVVGFANAWLDTKATAIADANKVLFMIFPLKKQVEVKTARRIAPIRCFLRIFYARAMVGR